METYYYKTFEGSTMIMQVFHIPKTYTTPKPKRLLDFFS